MADYGARIDELGRQLLTAQLTTDEITRIIAALPSWATARDDALKGLLDALANETPDLMAGVWKDRGNALRQNYVTPISNLLNGIGNPSPGLLLWRERTVTIEAAWAERIADMAWIAARDDLALFRKKIVETTTTLTEKWSRLSDEDKRLEAAEAEASRRMTEALQQAVSDGTDRTKRYADNARGVIDVVDGLHLQFDKWFVDGLADAGVPEAVCAKMRTMYKDGKRLSTLFEAAGTGLSADVPFVTKRLSKYIVKLALKAIAPPLYYAYKGVLLLNDEVLTPASNKYREQLQGYKDKLPSQGAVLASFSSTRADVKAFLADTNLEKARVTFDRITSALDSLGDAGSDGTRTDNHAWASAARDRYSKHFDNASRDYETFVRAHGERFIGTVPDSVAEELLWTRTWLDREQGLANIGMDQRLREWRASIAEVGLGLGSPSSQLRAVFNALPPDVADGCRDALDGEWRDTFADMAAQEAALRRFMEETERRYTAEQIKADLARAPLRDKVGA